VNVQHNKLGLAMLRGIIAGSTCAIFTAGLSSPSLNQEYSLGIKVAGT
jgi:hypothetical protein